MSKYQKGRSVDRNLSGDYRSPTGITSVSMSVHIQDTGGERLYTYRRVLDVISDGYEMSSIIRIPV